MKDEKECVTLSVHCPEFLADRIEKNLTWNESSLVKDDKECIIHPDLWAIWDPIDFPPTEGGRSTMAQRFWVYNYPISTLSPILTGRSGTVIYVSFTRWALVSKDTRTCVPVWQENKNMCTCMTRKQEHVYLYDKKTWTYVPVWQENKNMGTCMTRQQEHVYLYKNMCTCTRTCVPVWQENKITFKNRYTRPKLLSP